MKDNYVKVLDIKLWRHSIQLINNVIISGQYENTNNCISATGAHGIVHAQGAESFKEILNSFFVNLPDGMPGVLVGRLKGAREMKRCYGPDFFKELMEATANTDFTHFLCGGNVGVAEELKLVCQEKFGAKIAGIYCPPFLPIQDYNYKKIAQEINESGAEIVWIGLSTPKQEIFAYNLKNYTNVKFICCVGAAFDFHIGAVKQAPRIMQKLALEWLFRLVVEPKRLWRRYFKIVPMFMYYNIKEFLMFAFSKKS